MLHLLIGESSSLHHHPLRHGLGVERQSIMILSRTSYLIARRQGSRTNEGASKEGLLTSGPWLYLTMLLLVLSFILASCSGLNIGVNPAAKGTSQATVTQPVPLAQIHWCEKPLMIFRDEGASQPTSITPVATPTTTPSTGNPKTVTDWSQVEPILGFVVYLPAMLPQNSCLVSASGTIHDPIFGGSFTIGYLLPDHSSISLAEAPLRSQNRGFQCSPANTATPRGSGTPTPSPGTAQALQQVCSGARDNTSIFLSANGSTNYLQQFFDALQPHVNWVPAS